MATSESAYTNYARQSVNRAAPHRRTGPPPTPTAQRSWSPTLIFRRAARRAPPSRIFRPANRHHHAAILWSGDVSPTIAVGAAGVIPRLTTATKSR